MANRHVRELTEEDAPLVNHLRQEGYASAEGFSVPAWALEWNRIDNLSIVLGAFEDGDLVASMRGEIIASEGVLVQKIECPWVFPPKLEFPVLLLSRASTRASHRKQGLNGVLRAHFITLARHWRMRFLIGTLVGASSRKSDMQKLGYEFFDHPTGWNDDAFRSQSQVQVAVLDLDAKAELIAKEQNPRASSDFPWSGTFPDVRYVDGVR